MNTALSEITVDGYRKYLNKILEDLGRIHPEELIADMLLDKHHQYQRREYERQMREELAAAIVQTLEEEEDETT